MTPIACKKCGAHIKFETKFPLNVDGTAHYCEPKIKVYTEEEKRKLEKEMKK